MNLNINKPPSDEHLVGFSRHFEIGSFEPGLAGRPLGQPVGCGYYGAPEDCREIHCPPPTSGVLQEYEDNTQGKPVCSVIDCLCLLKGMSAYSGTI